MSTLINIPDAEPIEAPGDLTVEEARSAVVALGYASVENARGTKVGNTISFQRTMGGEKGAR